MSWTLLITLIYTMNSEPQSHIVVDNIPTYAACVEAQDKHLSQLKMKWHQVASTCIQTIIK